MTFLWPEFIYLTVLIPGLIAFYIWALRRRRRFAVRYSSLVLLREAAQGESRWRRHMPFGLLVASLACLVLAAARPATIVTVPADQATIILAIDVSRSMCSMDIAPTRLEAAEAAAITFVRNQKPNTQIGIVAFSGFAELVQPPTNNRDALQVAIQSLLTGRRTAIGSAILKSLDVIAEIDQAVAPSAPDASPQVGPPVPRSVYAPDIVVLLTDGASNTGPSPLDAAHQAADRGVRVYTIGFGTPNGSETISCQSSDPSGFGGFGAEGNGPGRSGGFGGGGATGGFRRGIDEPTLKLIAAMTGGTYYPASSSRELESVFRQLPTSLVVKHVTSEVTVVFVACGLLLAAFAMGLSFAWHRLA